MYLSKTIHCNITNHKISEQQWIIQVPLSFKGRDNVIRDAKSGICEAKSTICEVSSCSIKSFHVCKVRKTKENSFEKTMDWLAQ